MSHERNEEINLRLMESRIATMDFSLPKGICKHIRKLKQEGRLTEALDFKKRETKKKVAKTAKQRMEDLANQDLRNLLFSSDPETQAVAARRLSMLLSKAGIITKSERESDIFEIYSKFWPNQGEVLRSTEFSTMSEVAQLAVEVQEETNL